MGIRGTLWQPRKARGTCTRRHPNGLGVSHVKVCIEPKIVLIGRRCPSFDKKKVIQNRITMGTRSTYNSSRSHLVGVGL